MDKLWTISMETCVHTVRVGRALSSESELVTHSASPRAQRGLTLASSVSDTRDGRANATNPCSPHLRPRPSSSSSSLSLSLSSPAICKPPLSRASPAPPHTQANTRTSRTVPALKPSYSQVTRLGIGARDPGKQHVTDHVTFGYFGDHVIQGHVIL